MLPARCMFVCNNEIRIQAEDREKEFVMSTNKSTML